MTYSITKNDPLLHMVLPKFDFANPPVDPIQIVDDLAKTMLASNGLGLAANQVGLPYRVFLIRSEHILACFNPIIVDSSDEMIYLEEGCLSYPGLVLKIKRPASIKVRYTEPNGNVVTTTFAGMTARIFQHELDHLQGITFQQRASVLQKNRGLQKQKKILRKSRNTNG